MVCRRKTMPRCQYLIGVVVCGCCLLHPPPSAGMPAPRCRRRGPTRWASSGMRADRPRPWECPSQTFKDLLSNPQNHTQCTLKLPIASGGAFEVTWKILNWTKFLSFEGFPCSWSLPPILRKFAIFPRFFWFLFQNLACFSSFTK